MFQYNHAFVRPVPASFVDSLKMEQPGVPIDLTLAKKQHEAYSSLLKSLIPNVVEVRHPEFVQHQTFFPQKYVLQSRETYSIDSKRDFLTIFRHFNSVVTSASIFLWPFLPCQFVLEPHSLLMLSTGAS